MVTANIAVDENGVPRPEILENTPLFLPSSLPPKICSLSHMTQVCNMETKLRVAVANDALADIRRQRRIIQALWQFKRINVAGMGNRLNTRMLSSYKRISHKIEWAAHKYQTAHCALVILDPEGTWKEHLQVLKKEDIRGPGKDPDEMNGRFVPSWIWLVPRANASATQNEEEFNDSMRAEWAKTRARMMRWQEEQLIVEEEMR